MGIKTHDLLTRAVFEAEDLQVRTEDGKSIITGYAAVFEKLSVPIWGMFREKIRAGAFANCLKKKKNIRALWNHNTDIVLGTTKSGTLQLEEDDKGLRFELELPDTQAGRDAAVSIGRRDVDGMSFGFRVIVQEWDEKNKKDVIRTLIEVDLREVSPTAFPAYPQTSVKTRSIEDDYNEYLQHAGEEEKKNNAAKIDLMNKQIDILEEEI